MKLRSVIILLLPALLVVTLASSACDQSSQPSNAGSVAVNSNGSEKPLWIAFLTNGPVSDFGYNSSHDEARRALEDNFKGSVKTTILENIPETADAERVMERLIAAGVGVIVATSFGYQDATMAVASRHPEVKFLQAWGFKNAPNVGFYSAQMYEVWYLMGIVAGRMTQTKKLGIVAAHPVPPMKWQINAYVLGARSVKPDVQATVTFINNWYDPVLASQAAEALINQGHDVICGVLDNSVGVAKTAERRGVWFIGHNVDLSEFAPTRQLVGTRWLWSNLYKDEIKKMLDGTWQGGEKRGGLDHGYVGMTNFSKDVTDPVKDEVRRAQDKIRAGELNIYSGPIKDNTGQLRVPDGKALTYDEIMAMDWLIEGVR